MKIRFYLKWLILVFVPIFNVSFANNRINEIENRLNKIEKKIDVIINNLSTYENLPQQTIIKTDQKKIYQSAAYKMTPGPILDIWLLDGNDLKILPNTPSLGSIVDSSKLFNFGSFRADSSLKNYYKNRQTGLMWSGFLNIQEPGTYLILHEIDVKSTAYGRGWNYSLYSKLELNDGIIIENENRVNGGDGGLFLKTTTIKLESGNYKFKLWLAVKWNKLSGHAFNYILEPSNINISIKLRRPSSNKPISITGNDLFHKSS